MTRLLCLLLVTSLLLAGIPAVGTQALTLLPAGSTVLKLTVGSTTLEVNGQAVTMDVAPFLENGRTWVPVRFVAERLGADVQWDPISKGVTITQTDVTIELVLDSTTIRVNGHATGMDVAPFLRQDRTWVPLRFVVENLGATVRWVTKPQEVIIRKGPYDAATVAFVRSGDLMVRDLSRGQERTLVSSDPILGTVNGPIAWSWDGLWLAFYRVRPKEDQIFDFSLVVASALDGSEREIFSRTKVLGGLKRLSFDPGNQFLLYDDPTSDVSGTLWLVPLVPSEMTPIGTKGDTVQGTLSAAGMLAAFCYRNEGISLDIYNDSGRILQIPNVFAGYAFDASGMRLSVATDTGLWIYDLSDPTASPTLVAEDSSYAYVQAFSESGKWLAVSDQEGCYAYDLDTGVRRAVYPTPGAMPVGFLPNGTELLVEVPGLGQGQVGGNAFFVVDIELGTPILAYEDAEYSTVRP
jgi:hypothetical protein